MAPLVRPALRLARRRVLRANAGFFWFRLASSGAISRLGLTGILTSSVGAQQPPSAAITLLCDIGSIDAQSDPPGMTPMAAMADFSSVTQSRLPLLLRPPMLPRF